MTHAEALLGYKKLIDVMLENESLEQHYEKLNCIREIIVEELTNPRPEMDQYLEQVITSILSPIKKELY